MENYFLGRGPRPVLRVGCPRERYNLGRRVTLEEAASLCRGYWTVEEKDRAVGRQQPSLLIVGGMSA